MTFPSTLSEISSHGKFLHGNFCGWKLWHHNYVMWISEHANCVRNQSQYLIAKPQNFHDQAEKLHDKQGKWDSHTHTRWITLNSFLNSSGSSSMTVLAQTDTPHLLNFKLIKTGKLSYIIWPRVWRLLNKKWHMTKLGSCMVNYVANMVNEESHGKPYENCARNITIKLKGK